MYLNQPFSIIPGVSSLKVECTFDWNLLRLCEFVLFKAAILDDSFSIDFSLVLILE